VPGGPHLQRLAQQLRLGVRHRRASRSRRPRCLRWPVILQE
jgi:hypothetical protein